MEVKPANDAVVLAEAGKAVELHHANKDIQVWIIMGEPDPDEHNIIDLHVMDKWGDIVRRCKTIGEILDTKEIRSQILEDRRDPFRCWLSGSEAWPYGRCFGGPGTDRDHFREPVLHWNVQAAFHKAAKSFRGDGTVKPWTGEVGLTSRDLIQKAWGNISG